MVGLFWMERLGSRSCMSLINSILLSGCIMLSDKLFIGLVVNGQGVVDSVERLSSPSQVIAIRGSSVWLHWNYTYVGDGPQGLAVLTYKEQVIRFNSRFQNTSQALAKKIGQNGALTLESPVPVQFNGRVEVISSNSTLVIHDLQYNDSTYQFSSIVYVYSNVGGSIGTNTYNLRPVVSIAVNAPKTSSREINHGSLAVSSISLIACLCWLISNVSS